MKANEILAHSNESNNSPLRLQIKITTDAKTILTSLIIPKGTVRTILGYQRNGDMVIDFGLLPVILLSAGSHLIEIVRYR